MGVSWRTRQPHYRLPLLPLFSGPVHFLRVCGAWELHLWLGKLFWLRAPSSWRPSPPPLRSEDFSLCTGIPFCAGLPEELSCKELGLEKKKDAQKRRAIVVISKMAASFVIFRNCRSHWVVAQVYSSLF